MRKELEKADREFDFFDARLMDPEK